jgi:GDPmannose 4,6-dehydratase
LYNHPLKALIFGATGQDGRLLSALLQNSFNAEVVGVSRAGGDVRGDVSDFAFVESIIRDYQPDHIFHLAAESSTRHEALFENHRAISTGTLNILESARLHMPSAKIFLSGSAMQFRNEGSPIDEQTIFEASSPYSVARIQSVYAARYFRKAFGMRVYVGYFFNHDSPFRSERHVNQKVVAAALRIAGGSAEKLLLGNIQVQKEFNYAGDIVEAVMTLVSQEDVFEAVIGSGKAHSIEEWLDYCFSKVGLDWRKFVEQDEKLTSEYQTLVSNPAVMRGLGWTPQTDLNDLADIMMGVF